MTIGRQRRNWRGESLVQSGGLVPNQPISSDMTSHYGRWGHSSRIGCHWLPRSGFSGAWVSWSTPTGAWSHTIGWCALGFNDRPAGSAYGTGGRALARSDARVISGGRGWSFANRSEMGRASIQRRRVELPADEVQRAVVWNQGTSPNREFRESRRETDGLLCAARPRTSPSIEQSELALDRQAQQLR